MQARNTTFVDMVYDLLDSCEKMDELFILRDLLTPIPEQGDCFTIDVSPMFNGVFAHRFVPMGTGSSSESWRMNRTDGSSHCFDVTGDFMAKYDTNDNSFFSSYQFRLTEEDAQKINTVREILSL